MLSCMARMAITRRAGADLDVGRRQGMVIMKRVAGSSEMGAFEEKLWPMRSEDFWVLARLWRRSMPPAACD